MNNKAAGIVLLPIGLFLIILGGIFLPLGLHIYQGILDGTLTSCVGAPYAGGQYCGITTTQAQTMIIESALALSIGVAALVGGVLLLRRKPIARTETVKEITRQ